MNDELMMSVVLHAGTVVGDAMLLEYVNYRDPSDIKYVKVLAEAIGDFTVKCPTLGWATLFSQAYVTRLTPH